MRSLLVLFVCYGNVYRSAVAEQCFKQFVAAAGISDQVQVRSRGIQGFSGEPMPEFSNLRYYHEVWAAAEECLTELGISLDGHVATPISSADMEESDIVIAMDERVYFEGKVSLLRCFPEYTHKIHRFNDFEDADSGIPDPVGNFDPEDHRRIVVRIRAGTKTIFDRLLRGMLR